MKGNAAVKLTALRSSGIVKDVAVGNSKKRPRYVPLQNVVCC